jgi:LuxR family maltose regulon positive regulatory protein
MRLAEACRDTIIALEHLRDGDAHRAEEVLRPLLFQAERIGGRRGMIACLYAPVLASALLERGESTEAQAMLAYRLDVIERTGAPCTILHAYRTLTYLALDDGDERRALDLLDGLHALATQRELPRLVAQSIAERIRVHALRGRLEAVAVLVHALNELEDAFDDASFALFRPHYELTRSIACSYAALARNDLDECERWLGAGASFARRLRCGHELFRIRALLAVVARQRDGVNALALLSEAVDMASLNGSTRLLADAHPLAVQMGSELNAKTATSKNVLYEYEHRPYPLPERPPALRNGLLTPKEAEILRLLDRGLSNKLIARAMEIGDETVKWHIKNLFLKLAAGTRKHAVDRARLLGLLSH